MLIVAKILGLTDTLAQNINVTADIERRTVSITMYNTTLFKEENFEKFIIQIITENTNGLIPGSRLYKNWGLVTGLMRLQRQIFSIIIDLIVYLQKGSHCQGTGLNNNVFKADETVQERSQTLVWIPTLSGFSVINDDTFINRNWLTLGFLKLSHYTNFL